MSTPQHRCVFVGNIPYDATEEQLVQICEEVGPVVSFRLVIDRETGKPKGYGFCEYRDEETAASARRNLQGYEINGRQLRVDYAENDKGVERNREQGRGGPGLASNYDNQKQSSGSSFPGDSLFAQPIGIAAAASAASVMAAALGEPQVAMLDRNQGASHSRTNPTTGSDPLTLHLASMSKKQLFDILHEIKVLAQQNQEHARQLLSAYPTLAKAIFQAQIILGIVSPQMASNFKQDVETQASQQGQLQVGQVKMEPGLVGHGQMIQQTQSQNMSVPPLVKQPAFLSKTQHGHSRSSSVMSSLGNMHQPALQQPPRLPYQAGSQSKVFKPSSSQNQILSEIPHETVSHGNAESLHQATSLSDIFFKNHNRIEETTTGFGDFRAALNASTSLTNIDDGNVRNYKSDGVSSGPNLMSTDNGSVTEVGLSQPLVPNAVEGTQPTQQAMFQQITPEMESVLLQQVMSLTPEQIKSLPAEQQQQVLQLQQLFHSSVSS